MQAHLLHPHPPISAPSGPALLASGFRPFFWLAALYGAIGVPLWIATLTGRAAWHVLPSPLEWHAHEMVFGYTGAVIAGFLLTAVSKWTGRSRFEGLPLAALCCVWLSARVLPFVPSVPALAGALVDVAFWLGLLAACSHAIFAARNRRNYGFVALLAAFTLVDALSHASRLGYVHGEFWAGHWLGVDLVTVAMVAMTARVVPSFTRNATQAPGIAETPRYDRLALVAMALVVALDAASVPQRFSAVPAGLAGIAVLARARHWGAAHTLKNPLLWILHLGHAWVGIGLVLRGLAAWVPEVPQSIALHAVTAGGIGLLTFGMMTRVTLGHTGRVLAVGPSIAVAMVAMSVCALLRVVGPLVAPQHLSLVLGVAAALWSGAFSAYLVVYGRALVARRVDGQPG
jgi:uncharacterized protein involved in response to NO